MKRYIQHVDNHKAVKKQFSFTIFYGCTNHASCRMWLLRGLSKIKESKRAIVSCPNKPILFWKTNRDFVDIPQGLLQAVNVWYSFSWISYSKEKHYSTGDSVIFPIISFSAACAPLLRPKQKKKLMPFDIVFQVKKRFWVVGGKKIKKSATGGLEDIGTRERVRKTEGERQEAERQRSSVR